MAFKKSVSLNEVASKAGVSVSTVSLVLNNRGTELRISENTQKKIRKIASDMGYISNSPMPLSIPSVPGDLVRVAIFFPNVFQDFPLNCFNKGIDRYAAEASCHIDWVYHPFVPNHLESSGFLFSQEYYDGIIVASPYENDVLFLKANHFSLPVILYNCQINDYTCICHDDYTIGRQAAEVFCRHHRKHIAVVAPQVCNKGINLRLAGFTSYISSLHLSPEQFRVSNGPRKDIAGGYTAVQKLFEQGFHPSAIFVINDLMTGGVLNFLIKNQLHIPKDVEVLSYGDTDAGSLIPSVSSYISKSDEMASQCLKSLLMELDGSTQPGLYYSFVSECVWRDSCPPISE